MGYNVAIISGPELELYEYEREISVRVRESSKAKGDSDNRVLVDDREDSLQKDAVRQKRARRRDNAKRAAMVFRRLVLSQLDGVERPILITLTYAPNETSLKVGYAAFRSFIKLMRGQFGLAFRYVCVPEFQKRGAIHFHTLFWGLPDELVGTERRTRMVATLWKCGFVYLKRTDGNVKLSYYLTKYMHKSFLDRRLDGGKAFSASRNCRRPVRFAANGILWPYLPPGVIHSSSVLRESEYVTQWLGRCHYKRLALVV